MPASARGRMGRGLRSRRDFVSESTLVADKYEVLLDSEHAVRAHELLRAMSG
ncbi:hypothetical protein ABZ897_43780 [Nonomuraea sp. NPDC046802]|uniref:hypothetical protein n=1 Tax=Nonomuraea sp. NPDC046802 TaxID=3154919 RepID=UPI0033C15190